MRRCIDLLFAVTLFSVHTVSAQRSLDSLMHHYRNAGEREWSDFPLQSEGTRMRIQFHAGLNDTEYTLALRQSDVRVNWKVTLNKQTLGSLVEDEKDLICTLAIPPGVLNSENILEIHTTDAHADDIRVGDIVLHEEPLNDYLNHGRVVVNVLDKDTGQPIPARITIVNAEATLVPVSATSTGHIAVRTGYVYTSNGQATIGLPAGQYQFFATRGFEYGYDSVSLVVAKGREQETDLHIRREVDTKGWAASDTHIHTYTWSRHGDASSAERVITIAGEGLELPVIADHNIHANLRPLVDDHHVGEYFTLINGNELTTRVGHFNIFPVTGETPVNEQATDWKSLSRRVDTHSQAVILNHARDIHAGFRPFDPSRHLAVAGMRLDGWEVPANAMEIINSGSQQTDPFQLTHDWLGMLNAGYNITPVGASDSHDVARFIVGQARTYIRCSDDSSGHLNIQEAVKNFIEGNVTVSFGLLTQIEVNDAYGPGELVPGSDELKVSVTVSGPAWTRAEKVTLFANGKPLREARISDENKQGVKWHGTWELTSSSHDLFLVAIAEGPAVTAPYWPIAKPFQPVSQEWDPVIFGVTGAVWIDGDRNGERNSARDYAQELLRQSRNDMTTLMQGLSSFHESVAVQAAALLHGKGVNLRSQQITRALQRASGDTRTAFNAVISALPDAKR